MVARSSSRELAILESRVGLDTSLFIYFLQDHPRYGAWCTSLFDGIERGRTPAVTSSLSLLEILVQPYRQRNEELTQKIYALLSTHPGLLWAPVTLEVADRAADLRARYRLSTPDAIHVATAILQGAVHFVGNEKALRRIKEIECVMLDDLI